jgi:hypothetical protein
MSKTSIGFFFNRSLIRASQEISPLSKCTKDAKNVYAPVVMVSIWGPENDTVYHNGSIDTAFEIPPYIDSTFKEGKNYIPIYVTVIV